MTFNEAHAAFDDALDAYIEREEALTDTDKHVAAVYVINALDALAKHWGADVVTEHVHQWLDRDAWTKVPVTPGTEPCEHQYDIGDAECLRCGELEPHDGADHAAD